MSQWVGVAVLAAGALAAGVLFGGRPSPPPTVAVVPAADQITVHVTGAVRSPGLVRVPAGARVAEAVAAAGGLASDALAGGINLAAPVRDGMQVVVPGSREGDSAGGGGPLSMSVATVDELTTLPGVGPVLAQRIVDHRERSGPFTTMEDLLDVPGIGESKLAALRDAAVP